MAFREPQDRRVVFSITMRSESTAALNASLQRLLDTIAVYHPSRRKATPVSQQQQPQLSAVITGPSAPGAEGTTFVEEEQVAEKQSQEPPQNDPSPPLASQPHLQTHRPARQVTLGGMRGPIRLPRAGRVHSRRVYLIQVSERALRQIAAESVVPLHDQVGEVALSQEQEGVVEVIFELE